MASDGSNSFVVTLYTDAACTQVATAQQVIDAFSAGGVRIAQTFGRAEVVMTVLSILHPTVAMQDADGGASLAATLLVADPGVSKIVLFKLME